MSDQRIEAAISLMNNFAERTGPGSEQPQRRYLWTEHQDINEVMLATSLVPKGFLVLLPLD